MAKEHSLATIDGTGSMPISKAPIAAAQKLGLENHGSALAVALIAAIKAASSTWGRYYADLCRLEQFGRAAFRKELNAAVKDKTYTRGTDDVEDTRRRSAAVRIAEFNTIARAMDAGIAFDATWSYHYAVGHARTALKSEGKGSTRGRKATPLLDKIKAYIAKNVPAESLDDVAVMVATMAKASKADKPAMI